MSARRTATTLRPSVLDRLIGARRGPGMRRTTHVAELRRSVARDLEWLLNARISLPEAYARYPEASASVLAYGLSDFATRSWDDDSDRDLLAEEIRTAILRFEPRLAPHSVDVRVLGHTDPTDARLRYQISAILHVEPVREQVVYDTDLDIERCRLDVREAD